jgi:hypothetical protein
VHGANERVAGVVERDGYRLDLGRRDMMTRDPCEKSRVGLGQGANRLLSAGMRDEPGERAIDALGQVRDAKQTLEQCEFCRRVDDTNCPQGCRPHGWLRARAYTFSRSGHPAPSRGSEL